jgi:hypothetical protein
MQSPQWITTARVLRRAGFEEFLSILESHKPIAAP